MYLIGFIVHFIDYYVKIDFCIGLSLYVCFVGREYGFILTYIYSINGAIDVFAHYK